jgi:hypothetical protein
MPLLENFTADQLDRRERRHEMIMSLTNEVYPQSTRLESIENSLAGFIDALQNLQVVMFDKMSRLEQGEQQNEATIMQLAERLDAMEQKVERLLLSARPATDLSSWNIVD